MSKFIKIYPQVHEREWISLIKQVSNLTKDKYPCSPHTQRNKYIDTILLWERDVGRELLNFYINNWAFNNESCT